jgi:hypothetical protein
MPVTTIGKIYTSNNSGRNKSNANWCKREKQIPSRFKTNPKPLFTSKYLTKTLLKLYSTRVGIAFNLKMRSSTPSLYRRAVMTIKPRRQLTLKFPKNSLKNVFLKIYCFAQKLNKKKEWTKSNSKLR